MWSQPLLDFSVSNDHEWKGKIDIEANVEESPLISEKVGRDSNDQSEQLR